jgi:hypothetical protein
MQELGVPQEMRMRRIGQASQAANDLYTHPLDEAHRQISGLVTAHLRQARDGS